MAKKGSLGILGFIIWMLQGIMGALGRGAERVVSDFYALGMEYNPRITLGVVAAIIFIFFLIGLFS